MSQYAHIQARCEIHNVPAGVSDINSRITLDASSAGGLRTTLILFKPLSAHKIIAGRLQRVCAVYIGGDYLQKEDSSVTGVLLWPIQTTAGEYVSLKIPLTYMSVSVVTMIIIRHCPKQQIPRTTLVFSQYSHLLDKSPKNCRECFVMCLLLPCFSCFSPLTQSCRVSEGI